MDVHNRFHIFIDELRMLCGKHNILLTAQDDTIVVNGEVDKIAGVLGHLLVICNSRVAYDYSN
jgi:hypothetical protein